ncbi:hypothetical protein ACFLV0_06020 [Chloroflexota bacterium]
MLNKLNVSQIAELSNLSKAYISQVKHGKCPPSKKLIEVLANVVRQKKNSPDYYTALQLFLKSHREGISPNTLRDYRITLSKALEILGLSPTTKALKKTTTNLT